MNPNSSTSDPNSDFEAEFEPAPSVPQPATPPPVPPVPPPPPPPPAMGRPTPPPPPAAKEMVPPTPLNAAEPTHSVPAGPMPIMEGLKSVGTFLFPPHLLTAYKGASMPELWRLYGWRLVGLILLLVLLAKFAYWLVGLLTAATFVLLVVGWRSPQSLGFLFGPRSSKTTVAWTFGPLLLVLGGLGASLEPKPVVTPQEMAAKRAQAKAEDAAHLAQEKAKEAEGRAAKAEKDSASAKAEVKAQAAEQARVAQVANSKKGASAAKEREEEPAPPSSSHQTPAKPVDDGLPNNVAVLTIPNVGKRQVGVVDDVAYTVLRAETTYRIGNTQAGGIFLVLHVAAINNDKKTHNVTTNIMKLLDDQDREFSISAEGNTALLMSGDQEAQFLTVQVQPGVTKNFSLVYDVPENAKGLKLKIPAGSFSFGRAAVIAVPVIDE